MRTFRAQLWLVPEYANEVDVEILLDEERIKVVSSRVVIGDWALSDVEMELKDRDIYMRVEGEEIIVWSSDPGFAPALVGQEIEASDDEPYIPYEPPPRKKRRRIARRQRE